MFYYGNSILKYIYNGKRYKYFRRGFNSFIGSEEDLVEIGFTFYKF